MKINNRIKKAIIITVEKVLFVLNEKDAKFWISQ